ncbi:unnamed protein product, partial [Polarella glacialis]
VCGLVFALRLAYEDAVRAGVEASALKSWPVCVRKDSLARSSAVLTRVSKSLGGALASAPLGEALPSMLPSFCKWWLRASEGRDPVALQSSIWPALEEGLFPEKASMTTMVSSFRGLAELAVHLRDASSQDPKVEKLLPGLFEQLPRGVTLLLKALAWPKAPSHMAAVYAHCNLVGMVSGVRGGVQSGSHGQQESQKNGKRKGGPQDPSSGTGLADELPWGALSDDTRLSILSALQQHQVFGTMPGHLQRQWQQALLSPLSPPGIRSRCAVMLKMLSGTQGLADEEQDGTPRVNAAQLEQLAVHSRAPDEAILAVLCFLFTAAYFGPEGDKTATSVGTAGNYSLRSFKSSSGLPGMPADCEDIVIPVLTGLQDLGTNIVGDRSAWRTKLQSALASLARRTPPEAAEKLQSSNEEPAGNDAQADTSVRTCAFQGCLSDGSLLVLRLHDWWDHISEQGPSPSAAMSPRISPKKKKQRSETSTGGALNCIVALKDADVSLRRKAVDACRKILAEPEENGGLSTRQKNAICGLPLSLALGLLSAESETDRRQASEPLTEVLEILVQIPGTALPKQKAKTQKKRAEILASIPTVAAELFVQDVQVLVREAAKVAWRELGMFTSDETLTSLCASVRDEAAEAPEEEDEDEEDEDEDDDGPVTVAQAARTAAFEQATKEGRARAAAAAARSGGNQGSDDDDEDLTTLDNDGVMAQLLNGDDGATALLEAFASAGLEGATPSQKKLTKRQQQLRSKQDEVNRKFREVELLEIFLFRFGDKRATSIRLIHDLYEALLKASSNGSGSQRSKGGEAGGEADEDGSGKGGKNKKQSKADNALRRLEAGFSQRLCKLLARVLRQLCRGSVVAEVSRWHSAEEWASQARALCALGQSQKMAGSGPKSLEVGSTLLYFLCAAHRAASCDQDTSQLSGVEGWSLAEELLGNVLREWGGKRDCDAFCQSACKAFAVRAPHLLRRLPWMDQIKGARKAFAQRSLLTFVANELLRPASTSQGEKEVSANTQTGPPAAFVDGYSELCAQLLEDSLTSEEAGSAASTVSQKQKLRREALHGLKSAMRLRQKSGEKAHGSGSGGTALPPFSAAAAANVARAVAG